MSMSELDECPHPRCILLRYNMPVSDGQLDAIGAHIHPDEGDTFEEAMAAARQGVDEQIEVRQRILDDGGRVFRGGYTDDPRQAPPGAFDAPT